MDPLRGYALSHEVLRLISELDEFKGRWEALGNLAPERLSSLRRVATIESVASSTRIEGAKLTDAQVERLLSGIAVRRFHTRDEQEVVGYHDLMTLIYESWREISLTENHIKQLHGVLLAHSEKDERHRGHYKTLPNHVEAFDEHGQSLGVIFETTSPFETPRQMAELVSWTQGALRSDTLHPLLVIATFIVRFLAVHPFQDGNGRLSRALTTLLLLRAGYAYVPYSSLERVVEDNKDAYYLRLRQAQSTLDKGESRLQVWIEFFLTCLIQQKASLEVRISREHLMAPMAPLSEALLGLVRVHGQLTVRQATDLTRANRNTVRAHLSQLVEAGHLVRRGRGRGTWYEKG